MTLLYYIYIASVLFAAIGIYRVSSQDDLENMLEDKMFGGHEAKLKQYPYTVLLMTSGRDASCGGSILNENYVLTAAHCLGGDPSTLSVVAGITDICLLRERKIPSQQVKRIKWFKMHEKFSLTNKPFSIDNDIGIIMVDTPFVLNEFVNTVKLPTQPLSDPNSVCTATGWGYTMDDRNIKGTRVEDPGYFGILKTPCKMRVGQMAVNDACKIYPEYKESTMICAGYSKTHPENSDSNICKGDSGGPLICHGVQHGIASFLHNDCTFDSTNFGAFTRVHPYLGWINDVLQTKTK